MKITVVERLTASENHKGWDVYVDDVCVAYVNPRCDEDGDPSPESVAFANACTGMTDPAKEIAHLKEMEECASGCYAELKADTDRGIAELEAEIKALRARESNVLRVTIRDEVESNYSTVHIDGDRVGLIMLRENAERFAESLNGSMLEYVKEKK